MVLKEHHIKERSCPLFIIISDIILFVYQRQVYDSVLLITAPFKLFYNKTPDVVYVQSTKHKSFDFLTEDRQSILISI